MARRKIIGEVKRAGGKTIAVYFKKKKRHPKYFKSINIIKTILAHDENNRAQVGDTVSVSETKPISKKKTWVLDKIEDK